MVSTNSFIPKLKKGVKKDNGQQTTDYSLSLRDGLKGLRGLRVTKTQRRRVKTTTFWHHVRKCTKTYENIRKCTQTL